MTLQRKLSLYISLITFISMMIMAVGMNVFFARLILNVLDQNINQLAGSLVTAIDTYEKNIVYERETAIYSYLTGIAENLYFQVEEQYVSYQEGLLTEAEMWEKISSIILAAKVRETGYAYGLNSRGVLVIHPTSEGRDLSREPHIKEMMRHFNGSVEYVAVTTGQDKVVVFRYFSPLDLIIAPGVNKEELSFLYDVAREKALERDLQRLINTTRPAGSGFVFVLSDNDGSVLYRPENLTVGLSQDLFEYFKAVEVPDEGRMIFPKESGFPFYTFIKRSPASEKMIFLMLPASDVNAFTGRMLMFIAGILVFSLGIIFFIVYLLARAVSRPLTALVEKTDALARGHYITLPPVEGDFEELVSLGKSFERMFEAVRDRDLILERRVSERTRLLRTLFMVSQRMVQAYNFSELLTAVVEELPLKDINRLVLVEVVYDDEENARNLHVLANWFSGQGRAPYPVGTEIELEEISYILDIKSKEPVFYPDISEIKGIPEEGIEGLKSIDVVSLGILPLWYQSRQVGYLFLISEQPHDYSNEEINTYHSLLGPLSAAIENRRLFMELTERAEELNRARLAAEDANKTKSVFLGNISHELRTPMNAILGFSRLLREMRPLDEERIDNYIGIILQNGHHLLSLIDDLLDITRIEAGKIELNATVHSLYTILEDVSIVMKQRAGEKGLTFQWITFPEDSPVVLADSRKIRQILMNLVSNGIKCTKQGKITLRSGWELSEGGKTIKVSFEVEDTGMGIPRDEIDRIFEPFEQISKNNHASGTGLGLSIVRQYIQLMGGDISVTSQPKQGSLFRFTLYLPLAES